MGIERIHRARRVRLNGNPLVLASKFPRQSLSGV